MIPGSRSCQDLGPPGLTSLLRPQAAVPSAGWNQTFLIVPAVVIHSSICSFYCKVCGGNIGGWGFGVMQMGRPYFFARELIICWSIITLSSIEFAFLFKSGHSFLGWYLVSTFWSISRVGLEYPVTGIKTKGGLLYLLIKIKFCEIEGARCLLLLEEELRIQVRHLLSSRLNTSKTMSFKSWYCDSFFFFFLICRFFPLAVPVAVYSHHLLCFYHLQKGLARGGGAAAVAWKRSWLLATVSAGPAAQSTKPVPLEVSPFISVGSANICWKLTQY